VDIEFLIVGAQKCATSWIYYILEDHPCVHVPGKKLERAYLGGNLHNGKGDEWFRNYIGRPTGADVVGDVSVDYLFDRRSPAVVQQVLDTPKIIASLRSPIDRALSAFYWGLRRGTVDELNPNEGLERAINAWKKHGPDQPYDPDAQYYNMIARGMYARQLERFVDRFGPQSVYLVYYDDIRSRPVWTLRTLFDALGVDPDFEPPNLSRRPKQNSYVWPLLWLEKEAPKNALFGKITDLANQALCAVGLGREKPSLDPHLREQLLSLYGSPNERLSQLTQRLPGENILTPRAPTPPWIDESG